MCLLWKIKVPSTAKGGVGIMPAKHPCAWCGYPNAKHEGGYQKPNGSQGVEYFCCMEHFDLWLKWQATLSPVREQKRIQSFKEEVRAL